MDIKLRVLKAKIRGLEAEGRSIRAHITLSSGSRKDQLWCLKRQLGYYTRHHLIAYGLLRGVPYERIERNTATVYMDASLVHDIIMENVWPWRRNEWSLERVRDLMKRPKPEQVKEVPNLPLELTQVAPEQVEGKNLCTRALEFLRRMA